MAQKYGQERKPVTAGRLGPRLDFYITGSSVPLLNIKIYIYIFSSEPGTRKTLPSAQ